jgi:hypothetical protein
MVDLPSRLGRCQHGVELPGRTSVLHAALHFRANRLPDAIDNTGVTTTVVGDHIGAYGSSRRIRQAGTAVNHQGKIQRLTDSPQPLEVQGRLAFHAAMHRTDGNGEKIHPDTRPLHLWKERRTFLSSAWSCSHDPVVPGARYSP